MKSYEELAKVSKQYGHAVSMAGKWQGRAQELRAEMDALSEQIVQERFPTDSATVINEPEPATEQEQAA